MNCKKTWNQGGVLIMTLVFMVMFVVIFVSIAGLVSRTYRQGVLQAVDESAFQIAESGLNYGRWRLAHNQEDFTSETKQVSDPLAGVLGEYDVSFTAPTEGSTITIINATGRTDSQPDREVSLTARYGRPSLARYASIVNEDVWYGGQINGAVHANGGIRMDGTSSSLVTSARETYECQPIHGCADPSETKDGVWGTGVDQDLWEFPVVAVDYAGLTTDLLDMKTAAQDDGFYYGDSGALGYEIEFNSDSTYTISTVDSLGPNVWSWMPDEGWQSTSHDIGTTTLLETRSVSDDGIIYAEDRIWVSGEIRDRITVAAGVFPDTPSTNVDIILNGNITYGGVKDGTRMFAAVAQGNVLIPWSGAPDDLTLDGAFVAQNGSFHRRYYPNGYGSEAHYLKNSLNRYGMIASNGVPGTTWVDGSGNPISGYQSGSSTYDPNMLYGPPPYFPVSGQYEFISWEQN